MVVAESYDCFGCEITAYENYIHQFDCRNFAQSIRELVLEQTESKFITNNICSTIILSPKAYPTAGRSDDDHIPSNLAKSFLRQVSIF